MDITEACKFIKDKLGRFYNPEKVRTQLLEMQQHGLSFSDICERVAYWYDVRNGDASRSAGGITIINYIERDFQEWKKTQIETQKAKDNFKDFKLNNESPQIIHVKIDNTYKLPDST